MKDPHAEREKRRYEFPIASREAILQTMADIGEPVSFRRLAETLDIGDPRDKESLKLRLRAMVRDGQLISDRSNRFAIAQRLELFAGRISAHPDGYGFLICDEKREDIFLPHRQLRAVFHGDRALVRIRGRDRRGRYEGEIVEVLERNTRELVGRVYFEMQVPLLEPLNRRIAHEILIDDPPADLQEGQIVAGALVRHPELHGLAAVTVTSILGSHLTPDMQVEIALRNHDIPFEFSDDAIAEADALPLEVAPQQKQQRADLRRLDFVTIDGEDARDFDDAVYCERRRGGYRLFVAIADVANYVRPGSGLDDEARRRGTSVYFPRYTVPMLPEKLSNGLCSLNPRTDRLVMVCEMTISTQGRLGSWQFYEGVIHSQERLTYDTVGQWIEAGEFPRHTDSLGNLLALARLLAATREARGALDFDTQEVGFSFDAIGRVTDAHLVERNFAHRLIEECMLCANVSAARFIARHGRPGLYRVHEKPEREKVEYLAAFLESLGVDLGAGEARDYQRAIRSLRKKKNGHILQVALLRSMQQAVYQPENRGHFGLGYSHYAHFTSPIRRYPDLTVHRLIKSVIHSKKASKEVQRFGPPDGETFYPFDMAAVLALGEQCSFNERRADEAVYEVLEWIKCDYLSRHVGDHFEGVIAAVTGFGFFVQIGELLMEGLVHVSTLTDDYYHYEQGEQCLVGERAGTRFGMGDMVRVLVARVDVDERKVDLQLLTHAPMERKSIRRDRPGEKAGERGAGRNGGKDGRKGGTKGRAAAPGKGRGGAGRGRRGR